jgi:ribosomal protein L10
MRQQISPLIESHSVSFIIGVTSLRFQESLVQNVSENLDKYDSVYVFGYDNLRAKVLKDLRASMKDDRQDLYTFFET